MAETWVSGAYKSVQNINATFQEAMAAYRAKSDVQKALLWSEIVCGAANMALMVMSASARCFVEGTPVVYDVLPSLISSDAKSETRDTYGITVLDVLAGVAIAGALAVRRKRRRDEESEELAKRDLLFRDYGRNDESDDELDPIAAVEPNDLATISATSDNPTIEELTRN